MFTFSTALPTLLQLDSLASARPGKKYLFMIPSVLAIAASIFFPCYSSVLEVNAGGVFAGELIFRGCVKIFPKFASFKMSEEFIPKYIFIIYLTSLIASLTFIYFSVYIGMAISFLVRS